MEREREGWGWGGIKDDDWWKGVVGGWADGRRNRWRKSSDGGDGRTEVVAVVGVR